MSLNFFTNQVDYIRNNNTHNTRCNANVYVSIDSFYTCHNQGYNNYYHNNYDQRPFDDVVSIVVLRIDLKLSEIKFEIFSSSDFIHYVLSIKMAS